MKAAFDTYIADGRILHFEGMDSAGWIAFDSILFAAFKDFMLTVLDQIAEGNKIAA